METEIKQQTIKQRIQPDALLTKTRHDAREKQPDNEQPRSFAAHCGVAAPPSLVHYLI